MQVTIRYFASVREALDKGQEVVQTGQPTVRGLRDELLARGGAYAEVLARGKAVRVALNQVMCDEDAALQDGCELAFFPPVTGG